MEHDPALQVRLDTEAPEHGSMTEHSKRRTPVIYVEDIESGCSVAMPMPRGGSMSEALGGVGSSPPRYNGSGNSRGSFGQSEGDTIQDQGHSPITKLHRSRTSSESKLFNPISEKLQSNSLQPTSKISKRESLKEQKRNYRSQKKRAAQELISTLKDPSVIVLADWLKIRGTLKSWTKLWCVVKPGLLILYKSEKQKSRDWVGTVLLNTCRLIERPSKKDGFCFKLFHPLDQSLWATKVCYHCR